MIEGYEKGVLSLADLDGQPISWGDDTAVIALIDKIGPPRGHRQHAGRRGHGVIGRWPEMHKYVLHVKGLEQSAYDSREASSMALAYATSDIGAHHTRAWTIAKEIEQGKELVGRREGGLW